jgi:cbb3-type cytochrome oxidase maturation protein
MSVIYLVLPLALLLVAAAIGAFVWAARRGQFDDLTTPGMRVLHGEEPDRLPPQRGSPEGDSTP